MAEFDSRSRAVAGSRPPAAVRRTPPGWLARESVSVLRDRATPPGPSRGGRTLSLWDALHLKPCSAKTFPMRLLTMRLQALAQSGLTTGKIHHIRQEGRGDGAERPTSGWYRPSVDVSPETLAAVAVIVATSLFRLV